jgi:hypothetical protein
MTTDADTMTEISRETVKISDNGMDYEIDFVTKHNSARNISNGGDAILYGVEGFRLRRDGKRDLRLKGLNTRLHGLWMAAVALSRHTKQDS